MGLLHQKIFVFGEKKKKSLSTVPHPVNARISLTGNKALHVKEVWREGDRIPRREGV